MEYFKEIWLILTPIITAILTYFIAIRGKRKDVNLEKEKKLNIVISDLLDVFYFLQSLKSISDLNKEELPFPPRMFSFILIQSGMIDESCLQELKKSIKLLKSYDPVTYYDINGIGERFDYLQSNFITPLITSKNNQELNSNLSEGYLDGLIEEIKTHILSISRKANKGNYKLLKKRITREVKSNEIKEELINNYFDFLRKLPHYENFTDEELKRETSGEEFQKLMEAQLSVLEVADNKELMKIVAEDPDISVEEMKSRLGISTSS
ncbi:hypothetical protein [Salinimicrobium flavum]|uniref:Tellurite resistance protein TerB n=1 Tax=Salinimicrobium flavum TaxID=1737065 RepID=A0ABW5IY16_9FLAO